MYSPLLIMPVLFLRPKITALLVAFGSIGGKGGCWNRCWRRCCPSEGYRRGGLLYNLPVARRAARWELCLFGYHVFCTTVFCGAAIYAYSLVKLYHDDLDDEEGDNAAAGAAAGTDGGDRTMENLSKAGVIFSVIGPNLLLLLCCCPPIYVTAAAARSLYRICSVGPRCFRMYIRREDGERGRPH
mmetsp:Transcript_19796/g.58920  ORF Transcript_19796/g.58920 Transcript_19796/m.58920 type:complete len:185 (-) Transcript_19796:232-786(-)